MKKMMLMGLLFGTITTVSHSNENDGIFTTMIGRFEVSMIVEAERTGNTGILSGADESILNRYIPETGFKLSTNAFLIKTPTQNILIDTGTGSGGIVIEKIKKLGVEPEQVHAVLITHLHGDHFGSLQRDGKAVFPNAKIYLSQREYDHFTKTSVNQAVVAALAPYTAGSGSDHTILPNGARPEGAHSSNVFTFEPSELGSREMKEILNGIIPIAAYGHTPGHTIFLVQDGSSSTLIIGDLLHVGLVQFPVPEISATFDMDQRTAANTRRRVLDYALQNKILIGGMHINYPGMGQLSQNANGFSFLPAGD